MIESFEEEFLHGVRKEAGRTYWKSSKWVVPCEEIENLITEETWESWLTMKHSGSRTERRQEAVDLAHSARWRVKRRLDRYYRRKVIRNAWS